MNTLRICSILCLLLSTYTPLLVSAQADTLEQTCVKYRLRIQQFSDGERKILWLQPGDCPDWSQLPDYEQPEHIVPGSVYVTFDEPIDASFLSAKIGTLVPGAEISSPFSDILPGEYIYRIDFDPKLMTNRALLTAIKDTRGALINTTYTLSVPKFTYQWNVLPNDPLFEQQRHLKHIGAIEAFNRCPATTTPAKVAIIDNGFATTHPDLKEQLTDQYDVANKDADASVPNNPGKGREHGTVAAGIVGATANNALGVGSVGNNSVQLIFIKGTEDSQPGGAVSAGLEGMAKATNMWAAVINVSRGTPVDSPMVEKVTKAVLQKDILLVAAAGNQNTNKPFYPAAYPGVIGVSAIDANNERAVFSNFGDWVTISAPWVNIITTDLNDWYGDYQGTSEAAPLVAGAIGFALAHGFGWEDIQRLAIPLDTPGMGVGRLDITHLCKPKVEATLISQSEPILATRELHGVAVESDTRSPHTIDATQKMWDTIYLGLVILLGLICLIVIWSGIHHWWRVKQQKEDIPLVQ
jgi:hypothetical protein